MTPTILLLGTFLAGLNGPPSDTLPWPTVAPLEGLLPAELVASRVRAVLRDHTDGDAWQRLAGTLPDMIVRGGADVTSIFEAARLADEMSGTPPEPPPPSTPTATTTSIFARTLAWPEWTDRLDFRRAAVLYDNGMAFVAWVAMALLGVLIVPRMLRREGASTVRLAPVRSRMRVARNLAGKGMSIAEISRETRLAREALSVLLQPHGG